MRRFVLLPEIVKSIKMLVIDETSDGFFLLSYCFDGRSLWDSWHQSLEDAEYWAAYTYPGVTLTWADVPETVKDCSVLLRA
jgi:hypothetical protein